VRGTAGFVLVAVLWTGTALTMLAAAAGLMAWMQWSGARHAAEVQRARAQAEGALLWTFEALERATSTGGSPPVAPPTLPDLGGGQVRIDGYAVRADGSVDVEVVVVRPPVRVVAGARWGPP
jgi:hypothetical protein